jgi:hypothetical protein
MILQVLRYRGERVAIERAINCEVDAPTVVIGRTRLRPSLVGAIAVAQGGQASGPSAGRPPVPDRETLSIADLTDRLRASRAEREMRRWDGPAEREHSRR